MLLQFITKHFFSSSFNRKQLLTCPYLAGDEQIKLLNLQKNCIAKIANLDHLTSLVVLDLCENEIDVIQGLDSLTSLRILRLAKNKYDSFRMNQVREGFCLMVIFLELDKSKIWTH